MTLKDPPFISVLTPVYNGELYLAECIESVLRQTYTNFEYIILNNFSSDRSLEIASHYAARDGRIRVETNDALLPIIANHNRGFRLISKRSKYCKVVSADDWLFPECLEKMIDVGESHASVGLVGSYQLSGGGSEWRRWRVKWSEIPYPSTVLTSAAICRSQFIDGMYIFGTPTSLLYRADLVRKREHFYPNQTAEGDTSACYQVLQESDFGFVHQVLSYERIHAKQMSEESRTLNAYTPSLLDDLIKYGPTWLSEAEMRERKQAISNNYYDFLAARFLNDADPDFWRYHKKRLADCGLPFSGPRFVRAVCARLLRHVVNPGRAIQTVLRRFRPKV
jgi:glycosyltransferase involved in cell wall biosynthesis